MLKKACLWYRAADGAAEFAKLNSVEIILEYRGLFSVSPAKQPWEALAL